MNYQFNAAQCCSKHSWVNFYYTPYCTPSCDICVLVKLLSMHLFAHHLANNSWNHGSFKHHIHVCEWSHRSLTFQISSLGERRSTTDGGALSRFLGAAGRRFGYVIAVRNERIRNTREEALNPKVEQPNPKNRSWTWRNERAETAISSIINMQEYMTRPWHWKWADCPWGYRRGVINWAIQWPRAQLAVVEYLTQ